MDVSLTIVVPDLLFAKLRQTQRATTQAKRPYTTGAILSGSS